jgi:hypothetical protein
MKRLLIVAGLSVLTLALTACEEETITYEGKELKVSQVEDIISDKLEVENPGLDLELTIYTEIDD